MVGHPQHRVRWLLPEVVAAQVGEEDRSHRLDIVIFQVLEHRGERRPSTAVAADSNLVVPAKHVVVTDLAVEVDNVDGARLVVLMDDGNLGGELVDFVLSDRPGAVNGEHQFTHHLAVHRRQV